MVNYKSVKGITLIALVITIIILLILAGITISTLSGENGLFARAKQARQNTLDAQEKENVALADYENKIDEIINGHRDVEDDGATLLGIPTTKGKGTEQDPYIIVDGMQLKAISILQNTEGVYIKLGKDIDLSNICYSVDGTAANDVSWSPIGSKENQFQGTFDGAGYSINNLYINTTYTNQGLFAYLGDKGQIKNLTINGQISSTAVTIGGITSVNYGKIENCTNNATISSDNSEIGGIAGTNNGIIYRCKNYGTINTKSEAAGGIAGDTAKYGAVGFIIECSNYGEVSSSSWNAGGIAGTSGTGSSSSISYIYNCYNEGTVDGGRGQRAGIVGMSGYSGGTTYLYNNYNLGNVNGSADIIYIQQGGTLYCDFNYGSDATVEKLNQRPIDIPEALQETGLYRSDAWCIKDGKIVLKDD